MISDSTLYSLSIFLGSLAMLLIILYHFLEVNARPNDSADHDADYTTLAGLADEKIGVGAVKPAPPPHGKSGSLEKSSNNRGGSS
jgi:oligosaccharyl transferase complex subunit OST4